MTETVETTKAEKVKAAGIKYAERKAQAFFEDSTIADNLDDFATFDRDQLKLGKALGKGRFGTVYEVMDIKVAPKEPSDDQWLCEERQFIHDHVRREEGSGFHSGDARYAIKVLSPEVMKDSGLFIQGIYDMAVEARVLSDIEHTNIVKCRAVANTSPLHGDEFYIMMDRLYDTLHKRMSKWGKQNRRRGSLIGRTVLDRGGKKGSEAHLKKLTSAYDLASALGYLHNRRIIYRDLKPENIGFDIRDDIKLFDFGLATEMKDSRLADPSNEYCDVYKMTGMTGSPRYMANEVANEQPYNEKCDVYSFGILFWEMLSTKVSFQNHEMMSLRSNVWNGKYERPPVDAKNWSPLIVKLLQALWNPDYRERPTFGKVEEQLRHEIVDLRGGDDEGLDHEKRRSTFVFDKDELLKQVAAAGIDLDDPDYADKDDGGDNAKSDTKTKRRSSALGKFGSSFRK